VGCIEEATEVVTDYRVVLLQADTPGVFYFKGFLVDLQDGTATDEQALVVRHHQ